MSHEVLNKIDVSQYNYAQYEDSTQNFPIEQDTFITIVTAVSYANICNFAITICITAIIMFIYSHCELFAFRILISKGMNIITLREYDFRFFFGIL